MFYLTDPPASIIVSIGLSIEYCECFGFDIALNEDLNLMESLTMSFWNQEYMVPSNLSKSQGQQEL